VFMSTSAKRMLVATASAVMFLSHLVFAVQAVGTSTITLLATQDTYINSSSAPTWGDDFMVVGSSSVAGDMFLIKEQEHPLFKELSLCDDLVLKL